MLALIGVAAVVLLLGLGVAWLLAGSLARPLQATRGDRPHRRRGRPRRARAVEGSSEQREVASAFNDMTGRLARALRSQREFVANASHQLRTPLTGLRLRLEAAALKTSDPDVERELVAAERETVRLARLLSELLTLARERERPEPEEVSLAEVARAAHERWESPAETGGRRLVLRGEGEPRVAATEADLAVDPGQPRGERAQLLARRHHGCDRVGTDGASARLAVLDEGRGVDPASGSESSSASIAARQAETARRAPAWGCRWWRRSPSAGTVSIRLSDRATGGTAAEVLLPPARTALVATR